MMLPQTRTAPGWIAAATAAAALLSGAAVALTLQDRPAPVALMIDLAPMPAVAPAMSAVADPAPQVMDEMQDLTDPMDPAETEPPVPKADPAPDLPHPRPAMAMPEPDVPAQADVALPPPQKAPPAKKVAKAEPKPDAPKAKKKKDKPAKEAKVSKATSAGATAPTAGVKAKSGGSASPAAYAKAVMKKVRATRKQGGAGRGTVQVGFSIAADGSLAGVRVLQSSGNAALDEVAVSHIRRSAPFPAPPEGAGRSYSFEFVGK